MQTCQGIANVYYHKNSDRATERMQVLLLLSSFSKPLTPQTNGQRPVPKAVYACIIGTCPCSKNPLIWTEEEEPVHFPTNIQRSKPRWTLHALYIYIYNIHSVYYFYTIRFCWFVYQQYIMDQDTLFSQIYLEDGNSSIFLGTLRERE